MARFLDEQDDLLDEEREEIVDEEAEEGYLEDEETLEELDVDDRGHVRPRRRRAEDDEELDPEY
jgi:hypothetical protein